MTGRHNHKARHPMTANDIGAALACLAWILSLCLLSWMLGD